MFIAWTGSDSVSVAKPRNRGWADRGQKVLCRASGSGPGSGTRDRGHGSGQRTGARSHPGRTLGAPGSTRGLGGAG
jgi:hypothetical protein